MRWRDDDQEDAFYDDEEQSDLEQLEQWVWDNHPLLQEVLVEHLKHDDRAVRCYAALILAEQFQDVRSLPGLYEVLAHGNRLDQNRASDAIWQIGDNDPGGLIRALHFERGWVRDAIAHALEGIGWAPDDADTEVAYRIAVRDWAGIVALGPRAVGPLVSALTDPDGTVRRGAIWALGLIEDPAAVPFLLPCLDDSSGDLFGSVARICDVAAEALLRIGSPEALDAVSLWKGGASEATADSV